VAQLALGFAALALVLGLADAQDRRQPASSALGTLSWSALSVSLKCSRRSEWPEHHAGDLELGEHRRRDLARERALVGLVHRLGVDRHLRAARGVDERLQREERRADDDLDTVDGRDARQQRGDERSASATVLFIFQLPAMNGVRVQSDRASTPGSGLPSISSRRRRRRSTGA
jgi:hypothetical protein